MPEYICWETAKKYAQDHGLRQVVIVAWDGEKTHVVTYGVSIHESDQAAEGGNFVKEALGWPERLCNIESPRVLALRAKIAALEARLNSEDDGPIDDDLEGRQIISGEGEPR